MCVHVYACLCTSLAHPYTITSVFVYACALSGSVLSKTAIFPENVRSNQLDFRRICTGMAAARGQRLGEHQRRFEWWARDITRQTLRRTIWYSCSYHANLQKLTSLSTFFEVETGAFDKITLQKTFQTRKLCSRAWPCHKRDVLDECAATDWGSCCLCHIIPRRHLYSCIRVCVLLPGGIPRIWRKEWETQRHFAGSPTSFFK